VITEHKEELLRTVGLKKYFKIPGGKATGIKKYLTTPTSSLHAVDDVDITILKQETLGVVGESGCGKSTLGRAVLRLHEPTGGEVYFEGQNILKYNKQQMKELKKSMQIIFQDPFSSLNPRMTVGQLIANPMVIQGRVNPRDKDAIRKKVTEIMDVVGLAGRFQNSYPHELDGGRRQRIGIARALSLQPKFIVCDEPVSALDVSIQAQILNLMQDLQKDFGLTYLFITHDLSVVKHICDNIVVMYLGKVVEQCLTKEVFQNPYHPYTQALLSAIPVPDPDFSMERIILKGELSSPINPKPGCRFAVRCNYAKPECTEDDIPLVEVKPGHFVACVRAKEINNL